jgi:hypothetical protein
MLRPSIRVFLCTYDHFREISYSQVPLQFFDIFQSVVKIGPNNGTSFLRVLDCMWLKIGPNNGTSSLRVLDCMWLKIRQKKRCFEQKIYEEK